MNRIAAPFLFLSLLAAGCTPGASEKAGSREDTQTAAPASSSETASTTTLGRTAPAFSLKTLDGKGFNLADHRGEVVLINFWATWCGPCVIETPELAKLHRELKKRGFTVVGISLDEDGPEGVKIFAEDYHIPYPIGVDDGTIAELYGGIYGLPTTFVLDRNGKITNRFIGIFPTKEMRPELEKMLDASPDMTTTG